MACCSLTRHHRHTEHRDRRHLIVTVKKVALPPTGVVPTGQRSSTGTPTGEASTAVAGNWTELREDGNWCEYPHRDRIDGGQRDRQGGEGEEPSAGDESSGQVMTFRVPSGNRDVRTCCPLLVTVSLCPSAQIKHCPLAHTQLSSRTERPHTHLMLPKTGPETTTTQGQRLLVQPLVGASKAETGDGPEEELKGDNTHTLVYFYHCHTLTPDPAVQLDQGSPTPGPRTGSGPWTI